MTSKKIILVVGATGAQGLPVIDALLAPANDGSPSPYTVRALTRNPDSRRAKELATKGVELVQGSFDDLDNLKSAFEGAYGAWVNLDGFTVGEQKEIYLGMRIFELAKQIPGLQHYVWSSLDYVLKKSNYNPLYHTSHYDAKGRVAEWLRAQPSEFDGLTWSVVTSGPYMEMLYNMMFGPLNKRSDGTFVFATPVGKGHVPMIALADLGFWARYTFDNRKETSGKDLEVASDMVGWDYLVETFRNVTGQKAVVVYQSLDDWFKNLNDVEMPVANERPRGDGSTTWKENFTGFWSSWRDDVVTRDMNWIKKQYPKTRTLETWMRENDYTGKLNVGILKNTEDGKTVGLNLEQTIQL